MSLRGELRMPKKKDCCGALSECELESGHEHTANEIQDFITTHMKSGRRMSK